jgi:hypothetical protein
MGLLLSFAFKLILHQKAYNYQQDKNRNFIDLIKNSTICLVEFFYLALVLSLFLNKVPM